MQLTDWFPKEVTPVHIGVYQVKCWMGTNDIYYAYWDGNKFCFRITPQYYDAVQLAYDYREERTLAPKRIEWRGISKEVDHYV